MDQSVINGLFAIGGIIVTAAGAILARRLEIKTASRDRQRDANSALDKARMDDLAAYRREQSERIDKLEAKVESLQTEIYNNRSKMVEQESEIRVLRNLLHETAERLETVIRAGLEDIPRLKNNIESIVSDLKTFVTKGIG